KARLDDVYAQRIERACERHLRRHVHRKSGSLLAVSERRVEHDDAGGVLMHGGSVVAVGPGRSQSDNNYVIITFTYGPDGLANLPHRRRRAQFFACRRESAPDTAGGEPGREAARGRARRAAVRSVVKERHPDGRWASSPELRSAARPTRRGSRIGDA